MFRPSAEIPDQKAIGPDQAIILPMAVSTGMATGEAAPSVKIIKAVIMAEMVIHSAVTVPATIATPVAVSATAVWAIPEFQTELFLVLVGSFDNLGEKSRKMSRPRICIIGTGALGSLFAARLSAVADICVLGTWQAQLEAMRNGLTAESTDGSKQVVKIFATDDPVTAGLFDGVLVLVKSYQTRRSADHLPSLLKPDGSVLTLQNGLGNKEMLENARGKKRVLAGITTQAAAVPEVGFVIDTGIGQILLGDDSEMQVQLEFWKNQFQSDTSPDQLAQFEQAKSKD